ncbi:PilN domain-containing protein [bacterium]|nr:PilN domain-containing protein [bacterium]
MNHHFNVLHLDNHGLRWAQFEREHGRLKLITQGQSAGGPVQTLNAWLRDSQPGDAPIYLYDSRPLVFSFRVELPRAAHRRLHQIIPLRIRQELGLTEDAIFWTSRMESSSDRKQLRLRVFVVRRAALEDVVQWRAEHRLDNLWVGSDLAAINVLEEQRATKAPLVVVNAGAAGTTFYYADGQGRIFKGVGPETGATRLPELGWGAGADRALFGRETTLQALRSNPALSVLATAPVEGWMNRFENGAGHGEGALNDAVIIGGALVALARAPAMESLIAEVGAPPIEPNAVERFGRQFSMQQLAAATTLMCLLLVVSVWFVIHQRSSLAERLTSRVAAATAGAQIDQSELAVLNRIRQSRSSPMAPVFFDLLKAAPNGITLQRLTISDTGQVQIDGTVQDMNLTDLFRKSLTESKLFQEVRLPETQANSRQGSNNFKLTAQLKSRRQR